MYETALVGERHIGAHEDVVGDRLSEDFDTKDICDSGMAISKWCKIRYFVCAYISSVSLSISGCTKAT